jgi:hypothetical protein
MSQTNTLPKTRNLSRASWSIILASAITLVLYLVPFLSPIAYPFLLLSTLVHEMGHGLMAILVGGHFDSFKMWADGSGVAIIGGNFSPFSRALVAAFGLIGPSVVAYLFFSVIKLEHRARFMLASFGIVLVISIMLVVRNLFGIFFVAILSGLCFYFSLGNGKKYCQIVLAFFAAQLALSVFSRSDYLFTKTALTSAGPMPSDVAQIADALFLPYWFWGILCGLFSIAVLVFGVKRVLR